MIGFFLPLSHPLCALWSDMPGFKNLTKICIVLFCLFVFALFMSIIYKIRLSLLKVLRQKPCQNHCISSCRSYITDRFPVMSKEILTSKCVHKLLKVQKPILTQLDSELNEVCFFAVQMNALATVNP